ncbi:uncharacterized protein BDZ99DRAFT_514158 [Mytilinidion resinicola]|uniref:Uncharacterized protein n=1 Tax=Mytilinidion resinicola TaxID=574789 RepID=A0A6A6ZAS5_9PEZI|nr:uncharacterized protein BDZ99DRAFT_514158 [Mytilinidion resinicola]KAF2817938.1 hypothetical protein BDZ99DRAFT_514158 [Mytilinidion resinicola]
MVESFAPYLVRITASSESLFPAALVNRPPDFWYLHANEHFPQRWQPTSLSYLSPSRSTSVYNLVIERLRRRQRFRTDTKSFDRLQERLWLLNSSKERLGRARLSLRLRIVDSFKNNPTKFKELPNFAHKPSTYPRIRTLKQDPSSIDSSSATRSVSVSLNAANHPVMLLDSPTNSSSSYPQQHCGRVNRQ